MPDSRERTAPSYEASLAKVGRPKYYDTCRLHTSWKATPLVLYCCLNRSENYTLMLTPPSPRKTPFSVTNSIIKGHLKDENRGIFRVLTDFYLINQAPDWLCRNCIALHQSTDNYGAFHALLNPLKSSHALTLPIVSKWPPDINHWSIFSTKTVAVIMIARTQLTIHATTDASLPKQFIFMCVCFSFVIDRNAFTLALSHPLSSLLLPCVNCA